MLIYLHVRMCECVRACVSVCMTIFDSLFLKLASWRQKKRKKEKLEIRGVFVVCVIQ